MAFASSSSSAASSEINVTPLIDILLVLLIIFMVIMPTTPHGLNSSIPQGKAVATAAPPIVVRLLATGAGQPARYQIAREDVGYDSLPMRLRALFAMREDRTIFVEADRSLGYREVANVVSEAHEAGAGAVVLSGLHP